MANTITKSFAFWNEDESQYSKESFEYKENISVIDPSEAERNIADICAELEFVQKEEVIKTCKVRLTNVGFNDALASETAKAFADGDTKTIMLNEKKFMELLNKAIKDELLKGSCSLSEGE